MWPEPLNLTQKRINRMNNHVQLSKLAFGVFVTIVSVSSLASSSIPTADLNYYKIDCRIKEQQIAFLQSLRSTRDEELRAGVINFFVPWQVITNRDQYRQRADVHNRTSNWTINQLLLRLAHDCP